MPVEDNDKISFRRVLLKLAATGGFEPPIRVSLTLALTSWRRRQSNKDIL
jgi:hypothetical protein